MKILSSFLPAFLVTFILLIPKESFSQTKENFHETPKLVVGIMVDQMRADYIHKYWDKFGDNGFKRLVNEGFTFTNNHFDYMPTATGPGSSGSSASSWSA